MTDIMIITNPLLNNRVKRTTGGLEAKVAECEAKVKELELKLEMAEHEAESDTKLATKRGNRNRLQLNKELVKAKKTLEKTEQKKQEVSLTHFSWTLPPSHANKPPSASSPLTTTLWSASSTGN